MNTPADAPAWYAEAIARLAALPPNDYPDASYLPLKRAIAGYVGRRRRAGRGRGRLRRGAGAAARSSRSGRGDTSRSCAKPTYQLYTVASRNARRRGASRSSPGHGLALDCEALVAAGRRRARSCGSARPNNPTGERARRRARRAHLRGLPGHRRARPGLPRARRRGLLAADRRARQPRRHAHVLEGLRARRRARRLRPRAAARWPRRSTRCGRPARSRRGRRRSAELACSETDEMRERVRRASSSRARPARRRACARRASRCWRTPATSCSRARPCPTSSSASPSGACVVRTFAHEPLLAGCFRVTVSHRRRERPAPARARRARGRRGAGRRATACAASAPRRGAPRDARDAHRRAARPARRRAARASRPASASSTTCSRASRSGRSPTSSCAARGDLWIDEHHTVEDCAIALGEALDQRARRPRGRDAASADARAPLDEALAEATVDLSGRGIAAHRPRRSARRDRAACRRAASPTSSTRFARRGRHRPARQRDGRGRPPRRRGGLQGASRWRCATAVRARSRAQRHRQHQGRAVTADRLVDYGAGNLRSLRAAFERAGAEPAVDRPTRRGRERARSS